MSRASFEGDSAKAHRLANMAVASNRGPAGL